MVCEGYIPQDKNGRPRQRQRGKPLSYNAIYGYRKSPEDKNVWLVDEEAAVVRRIFQMAMDGMGPTQIARRLSEDKVERPSYYLAKFRGGSPSGERFAWNGGTIAGILSKPEYIGHTVNFRTYKESYKDKAFKYNPKDKWKIFEGTHEAIIDRETFDTVQKLRQTVRRADKLGEANPLTGLMFCGDCGAKMYNSRQSKDYYMERRGDKVYKHKTADFYTCSAHNLGRGMFKSVCSNHFIRTEVVRELVLNAIKSVSGYVRENEEEFIERVREASAVRQEEAAKSHKRQLVKNERRIAELDTLLKKVYEDNAAGRLSDKGFDQLSADYARELVELEAQNAELQASLDAFNEDSIKADRFIEIVRRYTAFDELTAPMLHEFVEKIVVHEADKSSGEREQQVDIYLNFIGKFDVPEDKAEPTPEELAEQ